MRNWIKAILSTLSVPALFAGVYFCPRTTAVIIIIGGLWLVTVMFKLHFDWADARRKGVL